MPYGGCSPRSWQLCCVWRVRFCAAAMCQCCSKSLSRFSRSLCTIHLCLMHISASVQRGVIIGLEWHRSIVFVQLLPQTEKLNPPPPKAVNVDLGQSIFSNRCIKTPKNHVSVTFFCQVYCTHNISWKTHTHQSHSFKRRKENQIFLRKKFFLGMNNTRASLEAGDQTCVWTSLNFPSLSFPLSSLKFPFQSSWPVKNLADEKIYDKSELEIVGC